MVGIRQPVGISQAIWVSVVCDPSERNLHIYEERMLISLSRIDRRELREVEERQRLDKEIRRLIFSESMDEGKLKEAYTFTGGSLPYEEFKLLCARLKLPHGRETGFTARELGTYVDLLQREKSEPGSVQVSTSVEKKRKGGIVTVTVLAPDWAGLIDSIVSVIHERGYNVEYLQGFLTDKRKYGMITVSLVLASAAMKGFLKQREAIVGLLKSMARSDNVIMKLLKGEARKLQKYREVIAILRDLCSPDEVGEVAGKEAERFFASRPGAYIEERKPEDLAQQILVNYRFQSQVREQGGVRVAVSNIRTSRELLTAISVAGLDREIALDDVLQGVREFLPNYQRKYDKEFVTEHGVAVFRVEIQNARDTWLLDEELGELEMALTEKLKPKRRRIPLELRVGAELFGRLAIPQLLREATTSQRPQVYILPEFSRSGFAMFKILLVAPVKDKKLGELAISCVNRLNKIGGLFVTSATQPVSRRGQEVDIIDIRADTAVFEESEEIYGLIKGCLRAELGDFRDFDEGLRVLDVKRLKELTEVLSAKGIGEKFVRNLYYNTEDFFRVSASQEEVASHIRLGWKAYRKFRRTKEKVVTRSETEKGNLFCVVEEKKKMDMDMYLAPLRDYDFSLTRMDEPGAVILLFRIGKELHKLRRTEVRRLVSLFKQ